MLYRVHDKMSSGSRKSEIVTLQFGQYANHVGAHFWNFQDELIGLSTPSEELENVEEEEEEVTRKNALANQNRFNAIDHECLYRQGETRRGEIVQTPRCVVYDMRSSLGGVKQLGYLCDEADAFSSTVSSSALKTWTGEVQVHEQPRVKKSEYLRRLEEEGGVETGVEIDLEEEEDREKRKEEENGCVTVAADDVENNGTDIDQLVEAAKKLKHDAKHWTDFSKALFHPRTVQVMDGIFETSSEGVKSFAGFGEGANWAMELDRRENLREDIRKWVEECDYLRGFHVFVEDHSGFGGLCEKVLEEVRDAHGQGVSVLAFCCRKQCKEEKGSRAKVKENNNRDGDDNEFLEITQKRNDQRRLMLNDGLSLARISQLTDAYIPLYGSQTNGQEHSAYQTSARIATAIDTITTPWRLKPTPGFESFVGAESMASFTSRMQSQASAPFLQTSMFTRRGDFVFEDAISMEPLFTSSSIINQRRSGTDNGDEDEDDEDAEEAMAESHVVRGAPFGQSRGVCEQLEKRLRAVQRVAGIPIGRCVAGASLPLPMTYPTNDNSTSKLPFLSVYAMTRQTGTQGKMLSEKAINFERASRSSGGKSVLSSWGYDIDDTCEVIERIRTDAKRYTDDDF